MCASRYGRPFDNRLSRRVEPESWGCIVRVQVSGGEIAYDEAGKGPAMILSHAGIAD